MARDEGMEVDRKGFDFYMEWHALGLGNEHLIVYRDGDGNLLPATEKNSDGSETAVWVGDDWTFDQGVFTAHKS